MKYIVSLAVDGRVDVNVEAPNVKIAKEKALQAFIGVNIGDIELINVSPVNATDEDDNITDYN